MLIRKCKECRHFIKTGNYSWGDIRGYCNQIYSSHNHTKYLSKLEYNGNDIIGDCLFFNRDPTKTELKRLDKERYDDNMFQKYLIDHPGKKRELDSLFESINSTDNKMEMIKKTIKIMEEIFSKTYISDLENWNVGY